MSFQRDYLLRMIEMMGDLVAALLGKIKKGDFEKADEQLEEIYTEFLRNDAAFFRNMLIENISEKLLNDHNYTNNHLQILAELFFVEAELQKAKGMEIDSLEYFNKSLILFKYIDTATKTYDEERNNKIKILKDNISELKKN